MQILYIVSRPLEINSSASLRNINTINGLDDLGHQVTVFTAHPDARHPQYAKADLNPNVLAFSASAPSVTKTVSAKFSRVPLLNKLRSFIYKLYSKKNVYDSWKHVLHDSFLDTHCFDNYDLIISSSDPKSSHLVAEKIVCSCQKPWIQIWGDPFSGDITNQNAKMEGLRKKEEHRLISKADKVVYLSELTALEMQEKYPDCKNKISFMPRPYRLAKVTESRDFAGQGLKLSYCGDYNSNVRNIKPLYDAVICSGDELVICGNSDAKLSSTEKISVSGRVSADQVDAIETDADVLVHISNLSGTQIPGKVYNYSATNKPILFVLDGDCEKIRTCFKPYNRYVFCGNHTEEIISGINAIRRGETGVTCAPVKEFMYHTVLENLLNLSPNN